MSFKNLWKCQILHLMNFLFPNVSLTNSFSYSKIVILRIFSNIYTCKCILRVGMPCSFAGTFTSKEGGMHVLAGQAPSSQTTVYLLTTAWLKQLAKSVLGEFTSMEKYTQLLLIERIRWSQKFAKPFYLLCSLPIRILVTAPFGGHYNKERKGDKTLSRMTHSLKTVSKMTLIWMTVNAEFILTMVFHASLRVCLLIVKMLLVVIPIGIIQCVFMLIVITLRAIRLNDIMLTVVILFVIML